jgi:hypothetical protein
MSDSAYDIFLDHEIDRYFSEDEDSQEQDWSDYEPNEYPDEELD